MNPGYSEDLRKRVVDAVLEEKKTIKEASELYKVHYESARSWIKLYKTQGVYKVELSKEYKPRKINLEDLKSHVEAYPDQYLVERAEHFGVSISTIWKNLQKLNITHKKKFYVPRAKTRIT